MNSKYEHLDSLYRDIAACADCTEDDELRNLANEQSVRSRFMFHWLPFREGEEPFRYILFAMEPSATGVSEGDEYPQEGGFHAGLRFAIRKYLLSDPERESFLITNMAKCTIGGELCSRTRHFRWNKCSRFLKPEIELAQGPRTQFISIGRPQIGFIMANKEVMGTTGGRPVHYLTHYSPRNRNNFKSYAKQRMQEFETFCAGVYEEFRASLEKENADYELPQFEKKPQTLLAMLFKWAAEMSKVRREAA